MNFKDMVGKTLKVNLVNGMTVEGILQEYVEGYEDTIYSLRFENDKATVYVRARDVSIVEITK